MDSEIQNKDISIINLIEYLFKKYRGQFKIKDHWEGDRCAIGLTDVTEKYLIYISTIGLDKTGYFIALENPSKDNELPYEPGGDFDNLSLIELENKFKNHLRIK